MSAAVDCGQGAAYCIHARQLNKNLPIICYYITTCTRTSQLAVSYQCGVSIDIEKEYPGTPVLIEHRSGHKKLQLQDFKKQIKAHNVYRCADYIKATAPSATNCRIGRYRSTCTSSLFNVLCCSPRSSICTSPKSSWMRQNTKLSRAGSATAPRRKTRANERHATRTEQA